jgi:enamine deaminase RidA (YjgF/YER057c/UK114 family)
LARPAQYRRRPALRNLGRAVGKGRRCHARRPVCRTAKAALFSIAAPAAIVAAVSVRTEESQVTSAIEQRLAQQGLELPPAPAPAANYVPYTIGGKLLFVAGQLPFRDRRVAVVGRLGAEVSLAQGQEAARLCALNLLAQAKAACGGDLSKLSRCLKLGGFVACTPEFGDHPEVVNGASDLMVQAMGEAGRHARFAVGCASLPRNAAVEVEATFELA